MESVISILILMGLVWAAAFLGFSILTWTVTIGVALLIITGNELLTPLILILAWLIYLPAALFANMKEWRQQMVVKPALEKLKEKLPTISTTERIAIEAGDTWWEKELFCGHPDLNNLYAIAKPTLSEEEQNFLDNQVEHVCSLMTDWDVVFNDHDLPKEVWEYLKKEKFFAMILPKEFGGLGFSALAHSTVVTKLATHSISLAVTTMVPNSLGPAELLVRYGTSEQKQYYLPRLATGEDIPCFALTAPDAGSDAGSIPDTGIVCKGEYQGKEVIGIKLSWDKRYITLAPVTTLLGVAFHLHDPDHLLSKKTNVGITLCLIPASHPGVETGTRHLPMYSAFMNGPTRGKDVFIPLDWIIGGVEMAGQGWRMLMESLSIGRSISIPALSTGCGYLAYRTTGAYSKVRRQFKTPIAAFEGVEEGLGYIAGYTYLLEACRTMTAGAVDLGINPSIVSAIAKCYMTENARKVVTSAMDIHAGQMIQTGPRNNLANVYLAIPISVTVEGANILSRNLIIFGQGAIRCHPYILKEIELISAADTDIKELDKVLMSHVGFLAINFLKSFAYGITGGYFIHSPSKNAKIKRCEQQLIRMSSVLALLSDVSMILMGGSLKRRERVSARLADIMSQLYLASATLKYFHDHNNPDSDIDYVQWVVKDCLSKIQTACDTLLYNYPHRFIGRVLRWFIFPYGCAYRQPSDKLHHRIVEAMTTPSELRDRLTRYCYVTDKQDDLLVRLDKALSQLSIIDPLLKKLKTGEKLTDEETRLLNEYEELRKEIIQVNEFSLDLSRVIA